MNFESLKGFLPPHSFVMGKKKEQMGEEIAAAPVTSAPSPELLAKVKSNEVSYLFIGTVSGNSEILLQKMIDAMKVDRAQVAIANDYSEARDISAQITIALGDQAANELTGAKLDTMLGHVVRNDHGNPVLITYHPDQLIQNPALKKEAWEHLKKAIKESRSRA